MRIALINNNIVTNIIIAPEDWTLEHLQDLDADTVVELNLEIFVDIGYQYQDGAFLPPEPEIIEE